MRLNSTLWNTRPIALILRRVPLRERGAQRCTQLMVDRGIGAGQRLIAGGVGAVVGYLAR
jgi:hypothetical protein